MKHASRTARWMAGCLLALWCAAFLRAETTEKSMVRFSSGREDKAGR